MKYLRIGTNYYKEVSMPNISGSNDTTLVHWTKNTILDDHGRKFLKDIPKYDGFTVMPSHIDYKQCINGFYNRYHRLSHDIGSTYDINDLAATFDFLKHIFGDQFNLGLDYLTILWQNPLQILPILCLVSEDRNTGKTTFLNWMKAIFEKNMTINKNEDFRSRFNSDWSEKAIIAIDEVLLDRREDSERIKNLSTAEVYKTEAKGIDKIETSFFGKFILCSNNETNFILIDEKEIRYWVRKIPTLSSVDPDFKTVLYREIPHFVNYLSVRNISSKKKTRMWFSKHEIHTEALDKLVRGTRYNIEKELILILQEMFEDFNVDCIKLSKSDIVEEFKKSYQRISFRELTQLIEQRWKLETVNSSYFKYFTVINPIDNSWSINRTNHKGRHYTFDRVFINSLLNC